MSDLFNSKAAEQEEHHWLSVSDLMAGLMVVFLFIAIALMRNVEEEQRKVEKAAMAYRDTQVALYEDLNKEFQGDLENWNASIDLDKLNFVFNSPDTLFQQGKEALNWRYKSLLEDFFPRYVRVLEKHKNEIDEVRIEGHTSSIWNQYVTSEEAYFLNMKLSQGRTRNVLEYVYGLQEIKPHLPWLKKHVAAVGLSSSRPVMDSDNQEDRDASRRVTFRIITKAETKVREILELVE